jgi:membrane protease subunit HflC
MRRLVGILGLLIVVAAASSLAGCGPVVVNREGEHRIGLFLGDPVSVISEPGIALTPPFISIQVFDARWRHLASESREILTQDQERIVVDHYAVWRISEPLLFRRTFPAGIAQARDRIDKQVRGQLREVIGKQRLMQVLKDERPAILEEIAANSNQAVERFGVEIRDVRINRTDLPKNTEENIFARMRSERDRLARKYRAEGEEQARIIRAEADREALVIVAEARRDADVERGAGDAEATRIYAEAYSQDAELYDFVRSLEAYRNTLGEGTTFVLPPDHAFFELFQTGGEPPRRDGQ